MMKYLFLCSMGKNRSPTAAAVAANIAREEGLELKTDYDGIDKDKYKIPTPEITESFRKYNRIFVMEDYMKDKLVSWGIDDKKISCLYIEDDYEKLEHKLVRILENRLRDESAFDLINRK